MPLTNLQIAQVAHEVNRAYCEAFGDHSQKPWDEAADWQRESAVKGVEYALANPDATPEAQHQAWLTDKLNAGWKYGPVKDETKKEHPCCVEYNQLPLEQRAKDYLFRAVVQTMSQIEAS
jgi:hypothetical protein